MNAVEELEQALTFDQTQRLADFDRSLAADGGSSTQQLLDELLGVFEEDDSPMFPGHSLPLESYADSDE
jgi:hypothetical protein